MRVPRFLAVCLLVSVLHCPALLAQSAPVDSAEYKAYYEDGVLHGDVVEVCVMKPLPGRTIREFAATAPGVRRDLATGALTVRARSGSEPVFMVDDARLLGGPDLPFRSVQRFEVLTEGVPARYGEAAGGLVRAETDCYNDRLRGEVEALSSRATDAYGTDLGALSLRGPLAQVGSFELAGEFGRQLDAMPWGGGSIQLTDEAFALVQASPQSVYVEEDGVTRAVPFPFEAAQAATEPFTEADLRQALGLAADAVVVPGLVPTVETLGADAFERRAAKDDPLEDLRLAAGLTLLPIDGLSIRTTGRLDRQRAERTGSPLDQYASLLMNPDALYTVQQDGLGLAASLEHTLTPTLWYGLRASIEQEAYVSHPFGFSDQLEDALLYLDADDPRADLSQRYFVDRGGEYEQQYTVDSGSRPGRLGPATYALPGNSQSSQFSKGENRSVQVGGSVYLNLGDHQLELGAEVEQKTRRWFGLRGYGLAAFVNDGSVENPLEGFPNGIDRYDQLPYSHLRNRASYYGYSFNGLVTADSEDIDAFYDNNDVSGEIKDIAPFRPRSMAGYAETTSTLGPVKARIGLRLEGYDPNGNQLIDMYAPVPIRRAGDLQFVPEGIEPDYAVYFASDEQTVRGFRDLDGQFYDAQGAPTISNDIIVDQQGQVVQKEGAVRSEAFQDAPTLWSLEPRIHLTFLATDGLRLIASAERLSRRPDPALHVTLQDFDNLSSLSFRTGMVRPEFETVDAARLGVQATASPTVSASVAGFIRQTRGIPVNRPLDGSFPRYGVFLPEGHLDERGVDVTANWRPSPNVWVDVAYTLASAEGTATDANAIANLIWRASPLDPFPTFIFPAENDTRHTLDVVASARVPESAGLWLGGFGGGLVWSVQSGLPYTRLEPNTGFFVGESFTTAAVGTINSARLPWTHQLDLRLDRQISVGLATLELFAWIENVLGTENVLAVYRSTGQPDNDGFVGTATGQAILNTPEREALYRAYISGPVNVGGNQSTAAPFFYGQPRQIRLGLRASF